MLELRKADAPGSGVLLTYPLSTSDTHSSVRNGALILSVVVT